MSVNLLAIMIAYFVCIDHKYIYERTDIFIFVRLLHIHTCVVHVLAVNQELVIYVLYTCCLHLCMLPYAVVIQCMCWCVCARFAYIHRVLMYVTRKYTICTLTCVGQSLPQFDCNKSIYRQ